MSSGDGEPPRGRSGEPDFYDLRGLTCPLPVLKTRRRLRDRPPGSSLWIETSDPLAAIDIPAFCREAGHHLLRSENVDGGHRFLIERGTWEDSGAIPSDPVDNP